MADLIDRQAAIKAIENLQDCYNGFSDTYDKACIIGALEEVPPAQRTGRWIEHKDYPGLAYLCSECDYFTTLKSHYCPYCGARMEEQE